MIIAWMSWEKEMNHHEIFDTFQATMDKISIVSLSPQINDVKE